jgi:hypothetical protein
MPVQYIIPDAASTSDLVQWDSGLVQFDSEPVEVFAHRFRFPPGVSEDRRIRFG